MNLVSIKTICIASIASVLMIHCWLKCKVDSCTGNKHCSFLQKKNKKLFNFVKANREPSTCSTNELKSNHKQKKKTVAVKNTALIKMGNWLRITDPLRCAIENWSKVLLWSCSPREAHSAIHMSFPGVLEVIPNVCLWELKQRDSLSHSLAVSVSPHSLSLSPHKHTHTQTMLI